MNHDVLIYADRDDVRHKHRENVESGHECYWTVSGTPRQTGPGAAILFSDGETVHARAEIVAVEQGRIWFEPVAWVDEELPAEPVTRGFKYVD